MIDMMYNIHKNKTTEFQRFKKYDDRIIAQNKDFVMKYYLIVI